MVAPARLSAVPNFTIPVMVKVCGGPVSRTRTRWPTAKWYFFAVPSSMRTSSGVVGAVPSVRWSDDSCGFGSNDSPMFGAPPVLTAFPFGAMNCAYPVTLPCA